MISVLFYTISVLFYTPAEHICSSPPGHSCAIQTGTVTSSPHQFPLGLWEFQLRLTFTECFCYFTFCHQTHIVLFKQHRNVYTELSMGKKQPKLSTEYVNVTTSSLRRMVCYWLGCWWRLSSRRGNLPIIGRNQFPERKWDHLYPPNLCAALHAALLHLMPLPGAVA